MTRSNSYTSATANLRGSRKDSAQSAEAPDEAIMQETPTKTSLDVHIRRLDAALKKLATTNSATTRRLQVEIQMLVRMEECREFMDSILKLREDRSVLMDVFGGSCRRFAHIFAVMTRAREEFCTEGCKGDLRLHNCLARSEAIHNVLKNRGLEERFEEAIKMEEEVVACQWDVAQGARDTDALEELLESYPVSEEDEEVEEASVVSTPTETAPTETVEAPVKVPVPFFNSRSREPQAQDFLPAYTHQHQHEEEFNPSEQHCLDTTAPWDRIRVALDFAKLELQEVAYSTNQAMPFESEFDELRSKAEVWCQTVLTQFRELDAPLVTVQEEASNLHEEEYALDSASKLISSPEASMKASVARRSANDKSILLKKKQTGCFAMICGSK